MAKEKSEERKKEKKDKKRSETDGVSKPKKEKKEKKSESPALSKALTEQLDTITGAGNQPIALIDVSGDSGAGKPLLAALVPFANPLADDKQGKKVLKGVKKCELISY